MAYTSLPTVVPGDPVRASWGNQVDTDLDDLDARVTTLETAVAGADLNGLDDVAIGSPLAAGNVLTYDGATWENAPPAVVPLATGVSGNLPLANLPATLAQLLKATVTLTNAQILALPTTPITLIAAPGASLAIAPLHATVYSKTSAGAYTNINAAGVLGVRFATSLGLGLSWIPNDTAITNGSTTLLSDLLGTTTNKRSSLTPQQGTEGRDDWGAVPFVEATTAFTNLALLVDVDNNGGGNFTGGNAANTLIFVLYYFVETVP